MMIPRAGEKGFTLIELLLVMVIMGIMLAVIVPRAWRANVDAKYTLVRQNCTELASFAGSWAEQSLLAQDADCDCPMINYYISLAGENDAPLSDHCGCWLPHPKGNWTQGVSITPEGRKVNNTAAAPENTVDEIIDPSKLPRNPFNGASVFVKANNPSANTGVGKVVPGAICCVGFPEVTGASDFTTFALLFQGTDSTTTTPDRDGDVHVPSSSFYAGQSGDSLGGVRNGVFMARLN